MAILQVLVLLICSRSRVVYLYTEKSNPTSLSEIQKALKRLKKKITKQQILLVLQVSILHFALNILRYLCLNNIFKSKKVPEILKEGLLTPIYKKGDLFNPTKYRGISVTPILRKVLEYILNKRHNQFQSIQKAFTERTSSINAALILCECINESKHEKKPIYIAALDVQKAFDVVDHQVLLHKLYFDGIAGDD